MSKIIVIIGDKDLIEGLKIFGFDTFFFKEKDIKEISRQILENNYSICLIQERYFGQIKDLFLEVKEKPYPIILPVPDHKEIKKTGKRILRELSIRAAGAEIL